MDTNTRQEKYENAGVISYQFKTAEQVKVVLGCDIKRIRGFSILSEEQQALAEYLIIKYINGFGLDYREERIKPASIKREPRRFVLTEKDRSYSYLYDDGSVG